MSKLKGLFIDFNGVIIDAELPWFQAWQTVYARYGVPLSIEQWSRQVDTDKRPDDVLYARIGARATRRDWRHATTEAETNIAKLPVLPGVISLLEEARDAGVVTLLITNSQESWVESWLPRTVQPHLLAMRTRGQFEPGKPNGEMHLGALKYFGLNGWEVVGIEDSVRGAEALRMAGINTLYVPGHTTKHETPAGVARAESLDGVTVASLEEMFAMRPVTGRAMSLSS